MRPNYLQGAHGRTSCERLFGKQVLEAGLGFGEGVLRRQHRSHDMNVVLDARWDELLEVRAVQRRALAERWSRESVDCIRAAPWKILARHPSEFAFPPFSSWEIVCSFVIPISRRGGARLTVEDTCSEENVMKLLVCRVTHTAARLRRFERAMDDVGDQRLRCRRGAYHGIHRRTDC